MCSGVSKSGSPRLRFIISMPFSFNSLLIFDILIVELSSIKLSLSANLYFTTSAIAKACDKIQSQFTSAASSIAQRATLTAITTSYEPTYEMRDAFKHRRDVVVNSLRGTPGLNFNVPDGAFYLFPEVSYYYGKSFNDKIIHNGEDLCMFLLEDARVSLVAGTGFGSKNYIRISFAASEQDLIEACNRIKTSLAKLY